MSENTHLFADLDRQIDEVYKLARRSDPVTSRLAAAQAVANGSVGAHIRRIVETVRRWPGRTSAELAGLAKLERHEAARRTSDAEHEGLIRKGAVRSCSVSGRAVVTWWPVAELARAA